MQWGRFLPFAALGLLTLSGHAWADSHPPGVTYPLKPAVLQPDGLAQPLPSTRRYVLVWKDQLADAVISISAAQKDFIVTHYVGSQKLFQSQIDEYRQKNPNFLMLVYHLAYGLNGADQANPVGNITGVNKWGQEDTDNFTPYVQSKGLTRENAYQHSTSPASQSNRVSYPDPYWLMDVASTEWRSYLFDTLLEWQGYPTAKATGVFLDVGFPPWYSYQPDGWWAEPAGGASRQALIAWWNPRAKDYFNAMRAAFAPGNGHPRYLVIPNPDALVDGTDEPEFLEGTDGAFTENWQVAMSNPGDWNLSARRVCKYVTSAAKVWMVDITQAGTSLSQADREMILGSFLLLRNATSYIMLGGGDITWYPEYEIDLGGYEQEPPADLESLRVAGDGAAQGGLYLRPHVRGMVLVNSSASAQSYTLPSAMKRAVWSGGGEVTADGTLPSQTLTYDLDVPAGPLQVPARSVMILRDPAGAPPPGEEPGSTQDGGTGGSGGTGGGGSGGSGAAGGGATGGSGGNAGAAGTGASSKGGAAGGAGASAGAAGSANAAASDDSGGCGCRTGRSRGVAEMIGAVLFAAVALRRRRRR
ncbi:MAG: hypothetical protein HY898_24440 [Deltaproteobacteria bacterium]|nr:hypothetical protein [Deltaproteobacteria bacterium]